MLPGGRAETGDVLELSNLNIRVQRKENNQSGPGPLLEDSRVFEEKRSMESQPEGKCAPQGSEVKAWSQTGA